MKKRTKQNRVSKDKKQRRDSKLRRTIAMEAAQMMYNRSETEYFTAKRKAARKHGVNYRYNPSDLPSNSEIREIILREAEFMEGEQRYNNLKEMRVYALWLMEKLQNFSPKLIGSTLTGHVRKGSDIDIHVFSNSASPISQILDSYGILYEIERKRIVKHNQERIFTHIHVHGRFEAELTMYSKEYINYRFKSSITGTYMENATLNQLRDFLQQEYPEIDLTQEVEECEFDEECYEMFKMYLLPLEKVDGGKHHPEGDVLYHSLQVFELARQEGYAYDVEFLQAALLHDIGKAIDKRNHAEIAAEILEGVVSSRTLFLIRHHMDALLLQKGQLGHRKMLKIKHSEHYQDLLALRNLDNRGRERGRFVDSVEEALEYIKKLDAGDIP